MSSAPAHDVVAHRLQLPRATEPEDVLLMVRSTRPAATLDGAVLEIGDGGRMIADQGPRGAGRWTLEAPAEREEASGEVLPDMHGYHRAFPDGAPMGAERGLLDLAWTLARRLGGAIVTADGHRLEPHPCHIRDLTVVSPYALAPESLLELIGGVEPGVRSDGVSEDVPRAGYSVIIDAAEAGEIIVQVSRTQRPTALRDASWLDDAVDYAIVHVPHDEDEDALDLPDPEVSQRWAEIHRRIGVIAAVIAEDLGGVVVDGEGVLVATGDLR